MSANFSLFLLFDLPPVCLVIFQWMPDFVDYMLLSDGYFGVPVKVVGLCSGT